MDKWWSLLQAIVNLVISIWGAMYLGLVGVYVGTVLSRLVFVISRPCSTYRFLFGESPARYFQQLVTYLLATVLATAACWIACMAPLAHLSWITWILSAVICLVLPNGIFYLSVRP